MQDYRTEEERIDSLKKWLQERSKTIIAVIAMGSLSIFGWFEWQDRQRSDSSQAADLYKQLMTEFSVAKESEQAQDFEKIANQLMQDYQSTPYSMFASLLMASEAANKGEIDEAINYLQSQLEKADSDVFMHLIRLRVARLMLAQGDLDKALNLVDQGNVDAQHFSSLYFELRGDILLQQGDAESSKAAYKKALLVKDTGADWKSIVQIKLDDLGDELL